MHTESLVHADSYARPSRFASSISSAVRNRFVRARSSSISKISRSTRALRSALVSDATAMLNSEMTSWFRLRRFCLARSFNASERRLFFSVVIPSTVPFIITGLRLGIARALIGVVTAELYTQTEGIGVLIRRATELRQGDRALFGVLLFTVSGILGVEAIRRLESRFQKWRPATSLERR